MPLDRIKNNAIDSNVTAFVRYNMSTQTILDSYNVASVTRTATGRMTVNFDTAMDNVNYIMSCSSEVGGLGTSDSAFGIDSIIPPTVNDISLRCKVNGDDYNALYASVIIFGGKA